MAAFVADEEALSIGSARIVEHRRFDGAIVIDGEVMANVGKKGVIKDERVATRLCRYLQIRMPESNVDLFGVFTR